MVRTNLFTQTLPIEIHSLEDGSLFPTTNLLSWGCKIDEREEKALGRPLA